jgi:hypothetical protein
MILCVAFCTHAAQIIEHNIRGITHQDARLDPDLLLTLVCTEVPHNVDTDAVGQRDLDPLMHTNRHYRVPAVTRVYNKCIQGLMALAGQIVDCKMHLIQLVEPAAKNHPGDVSILQSMEILRRAQVRPMHVMLWGCRAQDEYHMENIIWFDRPISCGP